MNNKEFPTVCVDYFYKDPEEVRKLASTVDYEPSPDGKYPGKRSPTIDTFAPEFYNNFVNQVFSLFYDVEKVDISADIMSYFQIIEPFHEDREHPKNKGWIHKDGPGYIGIIYLTPDADLDTGTCLYRTYPGSATASMACGVPSGIKPYQEEVPDSIYEHMWNTQRCYFQETVRFNNVYNRFIGFESDEYHAGNNYKMTNGSPRLTQVFFIKDILVTEKPIQRSRKYRS